MTQDETDKLAGDIAYIARSVRRRYADNPPLRDARLKTLWMVRAEVVRRLLERDIDHFDPARFLKRAKLEE